MRENESPMDDTAARDSLDSGDSFAMPDSVGGAPTGDLLGGRYEVQAEIGSGASSITWRGIDRRLGRTVAIKILRREHALNPTFVQRFEREARAAAAVSHQNVVDVYDYGRHGELLYIVMQYVPGETLKERISQEGPLPSRGAARITRDVLAGLAAIHQAGIIHRDIKPQNILMGPDGVARVADFGVARTPEEGGLTSMGTTLGSAPYMAPEQAQAGELTPATDLYAVGIVLFEMLTGRLPFEAHNAVALMLCHIQTPPLPPSSKAPGQHIWPELDRIVMRALAKAPHERFASATAMRRELSAAIAGGGAPEAMTQEIAAPGIEETRATYVAPRDTWPPPPTRQAAYVPSPVRTRPSARPMLLALVPLLLALLALAGTWYVLADNDDGKQGDVSQAPGVAVSSPTATAGDRATSTRDDAQEVPLSLGETVTPAPTDAPDPTETPVPTSTSMPTEAPAPTRTLASTDAPAPTETPEPPPTETPEPEPTATVATGAIEPIDTEPVTTESATGNEADLSLVDEQGNTQQIQRIGEPDEAPTASTQPEPSGTQMLEFSASDWQGAYFQETGNGQPWSALYAQSTGYGEGALRFDLQGQPASETFALTVQGITSENWSTLPMAIQVNGQEVFSGNSPFETWNGVEGQQPWTTVRFDLPAGALRSGENTVTFVNLVGQGEFARPPYILLASGTLSVETTGNASTAPFDTPSDAAARARQTVR